MGAVTYINVLQMTIQGFSTVSAVLFFRGSVQMFGILCRVQKQGDRVGVRSLVPLRQRMERDLDSYVFCVVGIECYAPSVILIN